MGGVVYGLYQAFSPDGPKIQDVEELKEVTATIKVDTGAIRKTTETKVEDLSEVKTATDTLINDAAVLRADTKALKTDTAIICGDTTTLKADAAILRAQTTSIKGTVNSINSKSFGIETYTLKIEHTQGRQATAGVFDLKTECSESNIKLVEQKPVWRLLKVF